MAQKVLSVTINDTHALVGVCSIQIEVVCVKDFNSPKAPLHAEEECVYKKHLISFVAPPILCIEKASLRTQTRSTLSFQAKRKQVVGILI